MPRVVTEHDRGDPRATMLALAATIEEFRGNLRQLKSAVERSLNGSGVAGLLRFGPHRGEALEKTLRLAHKQLIRNS